MADNWRVATVKQLQQEGILLVEDGNHGEYRPRPDEFVESGVAFIRATDMDAGRVLFKSASKINARARQRITKGIGAPGDVLLSHKGTVGKVALVPEGAPPFVCSPQTTFWRTLSAERLDRRYLYALLRSSGFRAQLTARAGETDMAPYVSLTSQRGILLTLPPIGTQRAIAHILGSLDDKIDLNRRMDEILEAMVRAIFKAWFVDFDPVKSKAAGATGFRGMPQYVFEQLPHQMLDSAFGPIPAGWELGTLADISDLNPESWSAREFPDRVEYVDLANTKWGVIQETEIHPWDTAPSRARRILRCGDTIIGTVRPGNGSYTLIDRGGLTGSTGFAVLRPKRPCYRELIYCAATSPENIERLAHLADGAAYPAVRPEVVLKTEIVLGSRAAVEAFSTSCALFVERISANQQEIQTLAAIRDALLPKLISGVIRVSGSEKVADAQ